ncbi:MAG: hypothetical protein IOD12_15130 [Silvanigrellales bacterium]|nr:hypothetical protein [Silvanigrellales bacterium]
MKFKARSLSATLAAALPVPVYAAIPANGPLPSNFQANITCDTGNASAPERVVGGKVRRYKSSSEVDFLSSGWEQRIPADFGYFTETMMNELAASGGQLHSLVLIDILNVNGKPHYYYYGNKNWDVPSETWSSPKMMGVGMALHRLRLESGGKLGGDATFPGGSIRDDMDEVNDQSSNVMGGWYKALAGPRMTANMVHHWLGRKNDTFGGFHGVSSWDSTWYDVNFTSPSGHSQGFRIDDRSAGGNALSMLTTAEFMKRVGVNFRDDIVLPRRVDYNVPHSPNSLREADVSWTQADVQTLMFGNYPEGGRGGMMFDGLRDLPRNFQKDGHLGSPRHTQLDALSAGRWHAIAKGGSGCSDSRGKCEEALMAYICVPGVNGKKGFEFALGARLSIPASQGSPLSRLWQTYQRAVDAVHPGVREGSAAAPTPSVPAKPGQATAKQDTWLKVSTGDSSALALDSEKCRLPAGTVLGYAGRLADGSHTQLDLRFADAACPRFPTKGVYVFSEHFLFQDGN